MRDLEPTEQQKVEELYHRTADATIKTRCQIIVLSTKPMSVPQIAQVIFYSEDTVARCIHEFNQSRWVSLLPSPKGGRPPKVTPDYLKRSLDFFVTWRLVHKPFARSPDEPRKFHRFL